jgi:group I intron endonuclease
MNLIHNNFDINKPCIYKIVNVVTSKIYIGSTSKGARRYTQHLWALENKRHENEKLQNSVNKHGLEKFYFEVLETVEESKLEILEQVYLDWFKSAKTGYNISGIAERPEMNEATRAKISATKQERGFANQIAGVKAYQEANPEKVASAIKKAWKASSDKSRLVDEPTLIQIIKEYISMETPSIIVLAKKYGMCYSTLAKIFKRTSNNSKYKEFLTKIGFDGESIKDLRKPEIQADLILTQD